MGQGFSRAALGALAALLTVLGFKGWRAARRGNDIEMPPVSVPLLASGAALLFAYQFSHALWLMYPYVYLGLLTSAIDDRALWHEGRQADITVPST